MAPDLVSEFFRTFNDEVNRTRRDCDHRRDALQRGPGTPDWYPARYLTSGVLKGASVQAKLEALEAQKAEAPKELSDFSDEPVRLHPNLAAAETGHRFRQLRDS
jgi:hypothetical protein